MTEFFSILFTNDFLTSIFRLTTPILFAALGALVANKAGVTNIGLEGIMLFSALFGVLGSAWTNSCVLGGLIGLLAGCLIAALLGFSALYLKTDVILSGVIVNLIGAGGTIFLLEVFTGDKNVSTSVLSKMFPNIDIPFLADIPVLGGLLSGHNVLTIVAFVLVFVVWFFVNKTHFGIKLRAVGENPLAASSLGINVKNMQFTAIIISGALASLGGLFMSMAYVSMFAANMTAGRGFIALAAEAMGMGNPIFTMFASILFGFMSALAISFGSSGFLAVFNELFEMMPYIATIVALIIYALSAKRKKAKVNLNTNPSVIKNIKQKKEQ